MFKKIAILAVLMALIAGCETGSKSTSKTSKTACLVDDDCSDGNLCVDNYCAESTTTCTHDIDCGTTENCQSGVCVDISATEDACTVDADCTEDGYICDTTTDPNTCVKKDDSVACESDDECTVEGQTCQDNVCAYAEGLCATDSDCDAGYNCNDNGICTSGGSSGKEVSITSTFTNWQIACDDDESKSFEKAIKSDCADCTWSLGSKQGATPSEYSIDTTGKLKRSFADYAACANAPTDEIEVKVCKDSTCDTFSFTVKTEVVPIKITTTACVIRTDATDVSCALEATGGSGVYEWYIGNKKLTDAKLTEADVGSLTTVEITAQDLYASANNDTVNMGVEKTKSLAVKVEKLGCSPATELASGSTVTLGETALTWKACNFYTSGQYNNIINEKLAITAVGGKANCGYVWKSSSTDFAPISGKKQILSAKEDKKIEQLQMSVSCGDEIATISIAQLKFEIAAKLKYTDDSVFDLPQNSDKFSGRFLMNGEDELLLESAVEFNIGMSALPAGATSIIETSDNLKATITDNTDGTYEINLTPRICTEGCEAKVMIGFQHKGQTYILDHFFVKTQKIKTVKKVRVLTQTAAFRYSDTKDAITISFYKDKSNDTATATGRILKTQKRERNSLIVDVPTTENITVDDLKYFTVTSAGGNGWFLQGIRVQVLESGSNKYRDIYINPAVMRYVDKDRPSEFSLNDTVILSVGAPNGTNNSGTNASVYLDIELLNIKSQDLEDRSDTNGPKLEAADATHAKMLLASSFVTKNEKEPSFMGIIPTGTYDVNVYNWSTKNAYSLYFFDQNIYDKIDNVKVQMDSSDGLAGRISLYIFRPGHSDFLKDNTCKHADREIHLDSDDSITEITLDIDNDIESCKQLKRIFNKQGEPAFGGILNKTYGGKLW